MCSLLPWAPLLLQQATPDPRLCQRLLDTHRQVWVSLFWGHCSFLLGASMYMVLFVPSKSQFPQSCVSSGSSMVGLMATSSKRACAVPRSYAPRALPAAAGHCWPVLLQETFKHRSGSVSVGSLVSGAYKDCLCHLCVSAWLGFDSKHDFAPLLSCWASPLPLDVGYLFWWDPTFSCWLLFSSKL